MTIKPVLNGVFAKSRFSIIFLFLIVNLVTFAGLRLALLIKQFADIDTPFYQVVFSFLLGLINDLAYFSYLLIPFVLYLLIVPNRVYRSKLHQIISSASFLVKPGKVAQALPTSVLW
jgi:hypothetical protein